MIILRLKLKSWLITFGERNLLSHQHPTSNPISIYVFYFLFFIFYLICLLLLLIKETHCSSHTLTHTHTHTQKPSHKRTLTQKIIWASTNMIWMFGLCAYSSLYLLELSTLLPTRFICHLWSSHLFCFSHLNCRTFH